MLCVFEPYEVHTLRAIFPSIRLRDVLTNLTAQSEPIDDVNSKDFNRLGVNNVFHRNLK